MNLNNSMLIMTLIVAVCGGCSSSPTAPDSSPSPTAPPASPVTNWVVTQRFVSVNGPDNCWVRAQRAQLTGAIFPDLPMTITRTGTAITLDGDFFQVNYAGTASGNEFSASGKQPLAGGGAPCQDGTSFQQMPGISNLSGRISGGDQLLTATEVNSYRLTSGEPVTYTWGWEAVRRN